jgi:rhamnulokinase
MKALGRKGGVHGAIDLGASSARLMSGRLEDEKLVVEEVVRVPNGPVTLSDGIHWDLLYIYDKMLEGIAELSRRFPDEELSVGIDGWGVDYGLVDEDGRLMGPPFHYRDQRTTGLLDKAESLVGLSSIYEATGIQVMAYNTLYQLLAEKSSAAYRQASKLLLIPDLLAYMFTGKARLETTNASTTQLLALIHRKTSGGRLWGTEPSRMGRSCRRGV